MVWVLTTIKRTIMRYPTGVVLLTICLHLLGRYLTRLSFAWPTVVQAASPPRRFFSRSSPVTDFPYGDLNGAMSLLKEGEEECIFVMYYAPWCARSIAVREEFDKASRYMEDQVRFVAVNCWYEQGSCRQRNNFAEFPMLYFYWIGMNGILYNGDYTADLILQFVFLMLHPVRRLSNGIELASLVALSDTAVLGYFDFSYPNRSSVEFNQFWCAAIRSIERDPVNVVNYAVITDRVLASSVGLNKSSSVAMIRSLSSALKFPAGNNFTSSALVQWTFAHRQQPLVKWIRPSGTKSSLLFTELNRGPALIAFIDYQPLSVLNNYHAAIRNVAVQYHNCNSTVVDSATAAKHTIKTYRSAVRHCRMLKQKMNAHYQLLEKRSECERSIAVTTQCCQSVSSCDACIHYHLEHPMSRHACHMVQTSGIDELTSALPVIPKSCVERANGYNFAEFISHCCGGQYARRCHIPALQSNQSDFKPVSVFDSSYSLHHSDPDEFISVIGEQHSCKRLLLSPDISEMKYSKLWELKLEPNPDLLGLGCRTNRSVRFIAMDRSSHYGQAMMSSIFGQKMENSSAHQFEDNSPTVAMVSLTDQVVHVMHTALSRRSLTEFLLNYSSSALPQFHRSAQQSTPNQSDSQPYTNVERIVEVTTETYNDVVLDHTKDVMLLYYAPWCGFCSAFSHVYLALARHFHFAENIVFVRINGAANDLPWHLKVDSYPKLIFFPAGDKSNSIPYPSDLPLSLPNLVLFVHRASSSSFEMRSCRTRCVERNVRLAVTSVQRLRRRISRLQRAIVLLRIRLGTQLNKSLLTSFENVFKMKSSQSTEQHADRPSPSQSSDAGLEKLPVGSLHSVRFVGSDEFISASTVDLVESPPIANTDFQSALKGHVYQEIMLESGKMRPYFGSSFWPMPSEWPTVCNTTVILLIRNELAILRRRVYLYQEQLLVVQYVYRMLLPVLLRTNGRLDRRHWVAFQKQRMRFVLRLRYYTDYVSGSDFGMTDIRW